MAKASFIERRKNNIYGIFVILYSLCLSFRWDYVIIERKSYSLRSNNYSHSYAVHFPYTKYTIIRSDKIMWKKNFVYIWKNWKKTFVKTYLTETHLHLKQVLFDCMDEREHLWKFFLVEIRRNICFCTRTKELNAMHFVEHGVLVILYSLQLN